ncbi:MAG: BamA/TamA family outer membrane protein [Tannerella sp.]|jgi:outer membrane protein assembly factor BamA|nr:BamA/TamA family outer membrane protein [Tannerella sp.]
MEKRRNILPAAGLRRLSACIAVAVATACSTTRNLPADGVLYTGIAGIEIADADSAGMDDELLGRLEDAFACPPNNALLGSSSVRIPVPLGLWIYNANVNGKSAFSRWMMSRLAARPVLISTVRPETRVLIARNMLRDNGYFRGTADYEIIPDRRDARKAKVRYGVRLREPYVIDSIEWRRMQHRSDTLLRLNGEERLVSAGDRFNTGRLEAERQRLSAIMQNNGYYYFRPEYIVYRADSTLSPHKVRLRAGLKQDVPRAALRPWKIGDISVTLRGYDNEPPTDSVRYRGLLIRHAGKLRVRPRILYGRLLFGRGELYSLKKQTETQAAIGSLDIFRFTQFRYVPKDTLPACDTMNVTVTALYDYPLNGAFRLRATANDNRYAGPGASLNLTRRNAFGGGEALTASVYGSYEWNTGGGGRQIRNTGVINNFEAGVKGSITFPRLVLPQIGRRTYDFSASSHLDLDVGLQNRAAYYRTLRIGGGLSYEFVPSTIRRHTFTPFRLIFNRLLTTTPAFDSIVARNPSLSQSLQEQFIPSAGYSYTLDNAPVRAERSKTWWRFSVSEAGNLVAGAHALFRRRTDGPDSIFGNPYAQFLKATTELRYSYYIDRNQRVAMRVGGGIVYSYGNSRTAPYNERFFVGGANSIRAFTIRSIGPGRFRPNPDDPYAYIDQNGDWKLEANIEYRGRLVGDLDIALFVDAGNVWLLRQDATRPGGTFRWRHFPNDIALGTGLGFRYDMDMLVLRLDIGYALHFPYDTRNPSADNKPRKYFNAPSLRNALGFHLALGYPF